MGDTMNVKETASNSLLRYEKLERCELDVLLETERFLTRIEVGGSSV